MSGEKVHLDGSGAAYDWADDWAEMPRPGEAAIGWAHHGLAVTATGDLVAFHPDRPEILVFDAGGGLRRSASAPVTEGHGITLVEQDGEELIWIADPGSKMRRADDGAYEADRAEGQAVCVGLDGSLRLRLAQPEHAAYEAGRYAPTQVAVFERRHGGDGSVWVADGYGQSLVHRFDAEGAHRATLSGEEGGGRFNCPHGVFVDRRKQEPELWIADRGNGRIQVYDLEGRYRRTVGEGQLNSPSSMAQMGDSMVVAELFARLAVLGPDDQLVGFLADNGEVHDSPGWPNELDPDGHPRRPSSLRRGLFNSPHGLAVDAEGNIYVAEWLIGGRLVRLQPST